MFPLTVMMGLRPDDEGWILLRLALFQANHHEEPTHDTVYKKLFCFFRAKETLSFGCENDRR